MQNKSVTAVLIAAIVAVVLITQTFFIVPEAQQALVLQFGEPVAAHEEPGLKTKVPFIQQVKVFDSRVLDVDPASEEVILADQKRLVVDTFARYRIVDMLKFHQGLGTEAQAISRLQALLNSSLRGTLGNVPLTDLLSEKRAGIMATIKHNVNASVSRLGIEIVDVRIVRADLPDQTSQSIYARMRSEREREAADFRAQGQELSQQIKSKADADRTIILANADKDAQTLRGQGDNEAIRIYAEAYGRDPRFFEFYRTMEAYRKSMGKDDTTYVLTPDSGFLRMMGE